MFLHTIYPILPGGATAPSSGAPVILRATPVPNTGATNKNLLQMQRQAALLGNSWRLLVAPLTLTQARGWAPSYVSWIKSLKDKYGEQAYSDVLIDYIPITPNGPAGTVWPLWDSTNVSAWWEMQPGATPRWRLVGSIKSPTWQQVVPTQDFILQGARI